MHWIIVFLRNSVWDFWWKSRFCSDFKKSHHDFQFPKLIISMRLPFSFHWNSKALLTKILKIPFLMFKKNNLLLLYVLIWGYICTGACTHSLDFTQRTEQTTVSGMPRVNVFISVFWQLNTIGFTLDTPSATDTRIWNTSECHRICSVLSIIALLMWCFKDRLPPLNNPQKRTYCWARDFVTPNGFLERPGHSTPVLLSQALLQPWAPQEPFPIPYSPSCEDETVNCSSSLGGWKRDICRALSNCSWHTVLRCTGEDGWLSKTLSRFFCLFPLSSMKSARDINAEEPKKMWNGKMEREKQALPTLHAAFKADWFAQAEDTT